MVPREGTTHIILTTSDDVPRSASSYAPNDAARLTDVAIDPTRGRRGLKLMHGVQHSCKEFSQSRIARLRHNLISNSLSIILSQWMVWILVFYPQVGPMHHPRPQVLNLEL